MFFMDKSHKMSGAGGGVWSHSFAILNAYIIEFSGKWGLLILQIFIISKIESS